MSTFAIRRFASVARSSSSSLRVQFRAVSGVPYHHDKRSTTPLIEHYRSSWPDVNPDKPAETLVDLPDRTISDDVLEFNMGISLQEGQSFFFPHLETNPADIKVTMKVSLEDLGLNREELQIFVRMVGKRLNVGKGELKLTCDKFPNKLENRKFLILQLEQLLAESRKLGTVENKFIERPKKAAQAPAAGTTV